MNLEQIEKWQNNLYQSSYKAICGVDKLLDVLITATIDIALENLKNIVLIKNDFKNMEESFKEKAIIWIKTNIDNLASFYTHMFKLAIDLVLMPERIAVQSLVILTSDKPTPYYQINTPNQSGQTLAQ